MVSCYILIYVIYKLGRFQATKEVSFKVIIFVIDQALAYGLLSGASVAARDVKVLERINEIVEEVESLTRLFPSLALYLGDLATVKQEYDTGVGGVVMGVFSFVAFGLSALLSGYILMNTVLAIGKPPQTEKTVVAVPVEDAEAESVSK